MGSWICEGVWGDSWDIRRVGDACEVGAVENLEDVVGVMTRVGEVCGCGKKGSGHRRCVRGKIEGRMGGQRTLRNSLES